jgi:hypothetical protein
MFLVALALVALAAGGAASAARAAGGVDVYVGYADSERANAVNFPTPWLGSPGVVDFEGCSTGCVDFDSSAVRLVNNTGSPITLNSVVVKFPGAAAGPSDCVIDIWPHNLTLNAGDQAIFTQEAVKAAAGCDNPVGTLDGSEMGPNGVDWGGGTHCTNSGIIPEVDATIDGTLQTFQDTTQVMNTGGEDANSCPFPINGGRNESEQWVQIGTSCTPGATLTLAPPTQTHFVGETATVTGTLDNGCGQPLQGATETFTDLTGPDTGTTGTGTTDINGQASFSYSGLTVGTDTLDVTVTNPAGTITSNTVNVIWVAPPLSGGTFVIGDQNAAVNTAVTFWGAQWWKLNSLSGGAAPAAFKGFALNISGPTCGDTWTTTPGNSPPPPAGPLPAFMPVIVSSNITKSGNTISGDIEHIVIVQTNSGYSNNPGHAGTGTVVSQVC